MATVSTVVDSTVYVEITIADDILVTNEGSEHVRIAFAASLPAAGTTDYLTLEPNQGVVKVAGLPEGNVYARAHTDKRTSKVTAS